MSPAFKSILANVPAPIAEIAQFIPLAVMRCIMEKTKYVIVGPGERYDDHSAALRRLGAGVDGWPLPPAGLFVVEERTVYVRSVTPMTVAHESFHALDCALGDGVYLSSVDAKIRRAFARATAFVTPYAASACDEYFAEAGRAFCSANDTPSLWPRATRERLWSLDPRMAAIVTSIFADLEAKYGEAPVLQIEGVPATSVA